MKKENKALKYNLQIFAGEVNDSPVDDKGKGEEPKPNDPINSDGQGSSVEPQLSAEEQLAKVLARVKVLEKAKDNACKDASDWKKKYRSTLDEKEQLDQEKAEREAERQAEFEALKRKVTVSDMSKTFMGLGYSEKEAEVASNAQIDNDFEELARIQRTVQERQQKEYLANYMKTQPAPPSGNDQGKEEDTFLKGFKGC